MTIKLLRSLLAFLGLLAVIRPGIAAAPAPDDTAAFTQYVRDAMAQIDPGAMVVTKGPLWLGVSIPGANEHSVYLSNIAGACTRDRDHCDQAIATFVQNMMGTIKEGTAPIERSNVRAVVRTTPYVEQVRRAVRDRPAGQPVVWLIAGDLWMVCVIDRPHGVEVLAEAVLAKLGLSADEAIALAKENLRAALPPLETVAHPMTKVGFGIIAGDYYDASRLVLHDDWAPLSRKLRGIAGCVGTGDRLRALWPREGGARDGRLRGRGGVEGATAHFADPPQMDARGPGGHHPLRRQRAGLP